MKLARSNGRRKCLIDLHDKTTLKLVSEAVSRHKGKDVDPKDCRSDAKTIISAYVLGQDVRTAAQRLLAWWCIDCGMDTLYLDNTTEKTVARVLMPAKAGYAALEAIEKYGTGHGTGQPKSLHQVQNIKYLEQKYGTSRALPKSGNAEIIPFSTT